MAGSQHFSPSDIRRVMLPRSKIAAGPGLNRAFFTSQKIIKKKKNNPRPGQSLVLNIDWTGRCIWPGQILEKDNPGPGLCIAFFISQKHIINPRPGQNLLLKIDWIGTYFEPEQILVQNNPGPRLDQGCMGHFLCQRNKKITQTGAK